MEWDLHRCGLGAVPPAVNTLTPPHRAMLTTSAGLSRENLPHEAGEKTPCPTEDKETKAKSEGLAEGLRLVGRWRQA